MFSDNLKLLNSSWGSQIVQIEPFIEIVITCQIFSHYLRVIRKTRLDEDEKLINPMW